MVALFGTWRPKADGTPDARIAFIDVPNGTIAYGPSGPRPLLGAGRYYVCWPTKSLVDNSYNDFVLARNTTDSQEERNDQANEPGPSGNNSFIVDNLTSFNALNEANASLAHFPRMAVNPKEVLGCAMPDAHELPNKGPFHSGYEPQGPPRALPNLELHNTWAGWNGQIFQFRLPRNYTIMGPLGTILTFDAPQHQRYDEVGNPLGIGGTYYIVPPPRLPPSTSFVSLVMRDLPPNVPLRVKTTEPLVLIRNGLILPRFVAPGVHEWSIKEGHLDFYGTQGCYDLLNVEGRHDVIPGMTLRSFTQPIPRENLHGILYKGRYIPGCDNGLGATQDAGVGTGRDSGHAGNDAQHNDEDANKQGDKHNAGNDKRAHEERDIEYIVISDDDDEEALQTQESYDEWINYEGTEGVRLEMEEDRRAQFDEGQERRAEKQKVEEQTARTVPAPQTMTRAQNQVGMGQTPSYLINGSQPSTQARPSRLRATPQPKLKSEFVDSTTAIEPDFTMIETYPTGRKRKNRDGDDDEYKPARPRAPRASRARNAMPVQKKSQATTTNANTASLINTSAMKQTTLTNIVTGTIASNSAPALSQPQATLTTTAGSGNAAVSRESQVTFNTTAGSINGFEPKKPQATLTNTNAAVGINTPSPMRQTTLTNVSGGTELCASAFLPPNQLQATLTTTASGVNASISQEPQATFNTTAVGINGLASEKPQAVPATVHGNNDSVLQKPTPVAGTIDGIARMNPQVPSAGDNSHSFAVFKLQPTPAAIAGNTNGPAPNTGNHASTPEQPAPIAGSTNGLAPVKPQVPSAAANGDNAFVSKPEAMPTVIVGNTYYSALDNDNDAPAPNTLRLAPPHQREALLQIDQQVALDPKAGGYPLPPYHARLLAALAGRNPPPVVERNPLARLVEAVQADAAIKNGTARQQLDTAPKVNTQETPVGAVDGGGGAAAEEPAALTQPADPTEVKSQD
ncbi:hypothetical protein GGR51DRAFT_536502 [Nemania sp. FL0031]|nr:hypothetical protein GGR51DRAFT_536502 [Nemania sp. FL0031]